MRACAALALCFLGRGCSSSRVEVFALNEWRIARLARNRQHPLTFCAIRLRPLRPSPARDAKLAICPAVVGDVIVTDHTERESAAPRTLGLGHARCVFSASAFRHCDSSLARIGRRACGKGSDRPSASGPPTHILPAPAGRRFLASECAGQCRPAHTRARAMQGMGLCAASGNLPRSMKRCAPFLKAVAASHPFQTEPAHKSWACGTWRLAT
jgi:hypothetical protein